MMLLPRISDLFCSVLRCSRSFNRRLSSLTSLVRTSFWCRRTAFSSSNLRTFSRFVCLSSFLFSIRLRTRSMRVSILLLVSLTSDGMRPQSGQCHAPPMSFSLSFKHSRCLSLLCPLSTLSGVRLWAGPTMCSWHGCWCFGSDRVTCGGYCGWIAITVNTRLFVLNTYVTVSNTMLAQFILHLVDPVFNGLMSIRFGPGLSLIRPRAYRWKFDLGK